jgi:hypothetical protein
MSRGRPTSGYRKTRHGFFGGSRKSVAVLLLAATIASGSESGEDAWRAILSKRVDDAGEVAYRSLAREDARLLREVLAAFARVDASRLESDGAIAFWINAYHATVLAAVLHGESPETVTGRARMYHWFGQVLAGKRRTLDELQAILDRYASADPRIHLAICNGARAAPRLSAEPFTAESLDTQLAQAARRFVNDAERNRAAPGRVELSRVFLWYQDDFEREGGSLAEFLQPLATRGDLRAALAAHVLQIRYLPFDWRLNAAPGERPR